MFLLLYKLLLITKTTKAITLQTFSLSISGLVFLTWGTFRVIITDFHICCGPRTMACKNKQIKIYVSHSLRRSEFGKYQLR